MPQKCRSLLADLVVENLISELDANLSTKGGFGLGLKNLVLFRSLPCVLDYWIAA